LYWITAYRRLEWNFALQHAAGLARQSGKPLVILEILKRDYPYASRRFHQYLLEGMAEHQEALEGTPVHYFPFVERTVDEGAGLVPALGGQAVQVVSDDYPTFIPPILLAEATQGLGVPVEVVDSNGLLPIRATDRVFGTAYPFRRFLQKSLPEHFGALPLEDPLSEGLPSEEGIIEEGVLERWRPARPEELRDPESLVQELGLGSVGPSGSYTGDSGSGRDRLDRFLNQGLDRYHEERNHPDLESTSGLSPYLHFGSISTHEIFSKVMARENWTPARLSGKTDGSREGWWGAGPGAEAFLDQLVTWRELGFNVASKTKDYAAFDSIPEWARETLSEHEGDPRPHLYSRKEFENAQTHDSLWNAAQRQLVEEGVIHNYLRMLWGKMVLEWSPSPREAFETMIDLNDRYALDGRDPNSYTGILWCLGRYDRGWPERPVFGKVRSMSSDRTRKKVRVSDYLKRFGPR
jgi:deoxyribodipyrimidine photo-lyase